jgi:hypothetical protein
MFLFLGQLSDNNDYEQRYLRLFAYFQILTVAAFGRQGRRSRQYCCLPIRSDGSANSLTMASAAVSPNSTDPPGNR